LNRLSRLLKGNPLVGLNKALDLAGQATGGTELEDDTLLQTYDTRCTVARERAPGVNGGIYFFVLDNVHAAAGEVIQAITPYIEDTAGIRRNAWPLPVDPSLFEIWIKGVSYRKIVGDQTLSRAVLEVTIPNESIALATVGAADVTHPLIEWRPGTGTTAIPAVGGLSVAVSDFAGWPTWTEFNYRLVRGSDLTLTDETSGGTVSTTHQCLIQIRILPIGTNANGG